MCSGIVTVQAWCHEYSTCPLRPSRPWLQEIVTSVRCLQRVFLLGKLKAAYVWASLPQPGGDVEQPTSLCANMTSSTKPEIHNVSLRRQRRTEDRATAMDNMHKIWWRSDVQFGIYDREQTITQTDRHARHNAPRSLSGAESLNIIKRRNQDFYWSLCGHAKGVETSRDVTDGRQNSACVSRPLL